MNLIAKVKWGDAWRGREETSVLEFYGDHSECTCQDHTAKAPTCTRAAHFVTVQQSLYQHTGAQRLPTISGLDSGLLSQRPLKAASNLLGKILHITINRLVDYTQLSGEYSVYIV